MQSPVIKNWLELPDAVLIPITEIFSPPPVLQPLAVPCLWEIQRP